MPDYKKLFTIVSGFSVLCVSIILLLGILLAADKKPAPEPKVCTTKACISAANLILSNIDQDQDPCVDFNKFSCGNFIKSRRIPSDASSTDAFTDLRANLANALSDALEEEISDSKDSNATKNAKIYYKSCLDEDTLEKQGLKNMIDLINNELGGCSLTNPKYDLNSEDSFDKIVKFSKWGLKPLFNVYISSNPKKPNNYVLRLQQADWFLTRKTYEQNNQTLIEPYKKLMKNVFSEFKSGQVSDAEIEEIYDLESRLAKVTLDSAERRNQTFKNFTILEFNNEYKGFEWTRFIVEKLFKNLTDVSIDENEPILVVDFSYLKSMLSIYEDAVKNKKNALHNMLIWSFIKDRTGFLPKKFRDYQLEFDKVYSGTSSTIPRARSCATATADKMPYAVGRLYVEKNFDENSKKAASEMIENIRKEFIIMLGENEWMDQQSKNAAKEKAELIDTKIGYPDYTYNKTYLDSLYEKFTFTESNYLQNYLKTIQNNYIYSLGELRKERDRKDWITGPAIVNAFYSSPNNQISFPAGILQAPFYDANFPNYLNYGGIGSVIGHEITHGFDDQGRRYDKNGIYFSDEEPGLWSKPTIEKYQSKAKCIVDQYSNFVAEQVNENLNGIQTQGENIADNGGVKESFRAYTRWAEKNGPEPRLPGLPYNPEQLFFINYAQVWCLKIRDQALRKRIETGVHSPGEFRIKGPTSNLEFFAKAFNCPVNSNNNPKNKCSVW